MSAAAATHLLHLAGGRAPEAEAVVCRGCLQIVARVVPVKLRQLPARPRHLGVLLVREPVPV